jgi:UDP-N-acetyl-D-galactosamine dehydrogenase
VIARRPTHDDAVRYSISPPLKLDKETIAVIGLGYVGLPLAVAFGKSREVIGFDVDADRIIELKCDRDVTLEVSEEELKEARKLAFSTDPDDLARAGVFIVTVPTPIDAARRPDLSALQSASRTVGSAMKTGAVVIYESTVYPGCTEEVCVPILEEMSGLTFNEEFHVGYSPERINPGDKAHRLETITKVTSGSTAEAAEAIDHLYASIITAGTHMASSIKVAEAAKVIENTQRDLNIALMNELALIFHRLNIDTHEVLAAAGTKWNFLPFTPGLVGGHCIGVDPYYLTHKAQEVGYHPDVILAGRRINDGMGYYVAHDVVQLMLKRKMHIAGSKVLVLGLTFKENCPDLRNSKVIDVIRTLQNYHTEVDVYDPWIDVDEAQREFDLACKVKPPKKNTYDAVIVAVGHQQFVEAGSKGARAYGKKGAILYDVRGVFLRSDTDGRL